MEQPMKEEKALTSSQRAEEFVRSFPEWKSEGLTEYLNGVFNGYVQGFEDASTPSPQEGEREESPQPELRFIAKIKDTGETIDINNYDGDEYHFSIGRNGIEVEAQQEKNYEGGGEIHTKHEWVKVEADIFLLPAPQEPREERKPLSELLETLYRSTYAADPTEQDQVIKDLRKQVLKIKELYAKETAPAAGKPLSEITDEAEEYADNIIFHGACETEDELAIYKSGVEAGYIAGAQRVNKKL